MDSRRLHSAYVPYAPSYIFSVCVWVFVCMWVHATCCKNWAHRCTVAFSCRSRKTTIWLYLTSCVNFVIYHKTVC